MLIKHSITNSQSATRNPESNGICKRMHATVASILRIIMRTANLTGFEQAAQVMDNALATCTHATRCAVHDALKTSPGALVYSRDMFVGVPIIADLIAIRNRCQQVVDQNLMQHNKKKYDYHYHVGDKVMITTYDPTKLQERLHGPYCIVETRTNGTVRVQMREPNVNETFNIRKLRPYKGPLEQLQPIIEERQRQNQQ